MSSKVYKTGCGEKSPWFLLPGGLCKFTIMNGLKCVFGLLSKSLAKLCDLVF